MKTAPYYSGKMDELATSITLAVCGGNVVDNIDLYPKHIKIESRLYENADIVDRESTPFFYAVLSQVRSFIGVGACKGPWPPDLVLRIRDIAMSQLRAMRGIPNSFKIRVLFCASDFGRPAYWRAEQPFRALQRNSTEIWAEKSNLLLPHLSPEYDVIIAHRPFHPSQIEDLKTAKRSGCKIIVDYDEPVWQTSSQYNVSNEMVSSIMEAVRISDCVTVPSPAMANEMLRFGSKSKLMIMPNMVSFDTYDRCPNPIPETGRHGDSRVRILCVMEPGTDFSQARFALDELIRNCSKYVKIVFLGHAPEEFSTYDPKTMKCIIHAELQHVIEWVERQREHIADQMVDVDCDIGIIPITAYGECAGWRQWIENSAVRMPSIITETTPSPVEYGKSGFLVQSEGGWLVQIMKLVKDKKRRVEIGENAHKVAKAAHDPFASGNWATFEDLLLKLCGQKETLKSQNIGGVDE